MSNKIIIINVNNADLNSISLMPHSHYFLIGTPSNFMKFQLKAQISPKNYIGIGFDDIDYMIAFGYKDDISSLQFHFKKNLDDMFIIVSTSQPMNSEITEIAKLVLGTGEDSYEALSMQSSGDEEADEEEAKIEETEKIIKAVDRNH